MTEPIKLKEIEKSHKDKDNLTVYQKYFDYLIVLKKVEIKGGNQVACKRIIYHKEAEENSKIVEFLDYQDPFMKTFIEAVNVGLCDK